MTRRILNFKLRIIRRAIAILETYRDQLIAARVKMAKDAIDRLLDTKEQ